MRLICLKKKIWFQEKSGFDISVASEIMAILCLSKDIDELRNKLNEIVIGYNSENKAIFAKELGVVGAMLVILKDAIKPNLVQTLEHTPAIIHGGPFANIAHGCNSVIATNMALNLGEYVITEAGFGSDLGAEKFFDIKCRKENLNPNCVVCVATIKALKYHGGVSKEDILEENIDALKKGLENLYKHIDNIKNKFKQNVIVAINKFPSDTKEEIKTLNQELSDRKILVDVVDIWKEGGDGAISLAKNVCKLCEIESKLEYIYELNDSIIDKINKICKKIYGAKNVIFTKKAEEEIMNLEKNNFSNLPICIAKTPYSFSDNAKNITLLSDFDITIKSIELKNGAGFIVAKAGKICTMPGLPNKPAAEGIDLDSDFNIIGLY